MTNHTSSPSIRESRAPSEQLAPTQQQARALRDLHASLVDLAAVVTGAGGLPEVLEKVALYATRAIPGADGAGVALLRLDLPRDRVEASAASDPFVAQIDKIQYESANEGPCITAALEGRTMRSGSLGGQTRWPRFGPRAGRLGIQSALSLPLLLPGQVVGAISVYARGTDVFDDHAQELGELFAAPAAVAVHNAHTLTQAIALTTRLQTSLAARPITDEAIGLIRARTGLSSVQAHERLQAISQRENLKLIDVAQHLVDDAVRRAQACDSRSARR